VRSSVTARATTTAAIASAPTHTATGVVLRPLMGSPFLSVVRSAVSLDDDDDGGSHAGLPGARTRLSGRWRRSRQPMPPRVPPAAPGRGSLLGSLRLSVARFPPLVAGLGDRGHTSPLRPTHRDDLSRSLRPQASAASTAAIPTPPQTTRAGRSVRCNRPPPRRTEPTVLEPAPRADRPPPCEECRGRRSRRAHRLACRDAASSGSRGTSPLRRRQLATRLTGVSRGTSSGQEARSKGAGGGGRKT
jgi:hypothetical protein